MATCSCQYTLGYYENTDSLWPQVMVEMSGGFKMGIIKFVGETDFAPGDWVGVAFDRPVGQYTP